MKVLENQFKSRKENSQSVPHSGCGKILALGSLYSHLLMQHGIDSSGLIVTEPEVLAPSLYKLIFIYESGHSQQRLPYLVDDCQYKTDTAVNLQ